MGFQVGFMVFMVFGWFTWVFRGGFMVFGWFPWFFKVVSWFFMVFAWFTWFDGSGFRTNFMLEIVELKRDGLQKVRFFNI